MNKPKKQKQLKRKENSSLFSGWDSYSPEDLHNTANYMYRESIEFLEFQIEQEQYSDHYFLNVIECRYETEEELEKRYNQELKKYNSYKAAEKKRKQNEKQNLIKRAKQLGLKIEE